MLYKDFTCYFSELRINRYYIAANNSEEKAIELYKANLKIGAAFHPLISIVEVVLRNQLNTILTLHFQDTDWIMNQKEGFMSDPSLIFRNKKTGRKKTNDFLKQEIAKTEKKLKQAGVKLSSGKIISEQTFGFWTDLFEIYHYRLLKGVPIKIFTKLPAGYGRKEIKDELDKIRRFRNRINHNEPVCFNGNKVDLSSTIVVYQSILDILSWIDPVLLHFSSDLNNVLEVVSNVSRMAAETC